MQEIMEIMDGWRGLGNWQDLLKPMTQLSDASNLFFFNEINDFLKDEIDEFGINLLGRTMSWMGGMALSLLTIWILIQGYRIITGQSRDSMMALVTNSLRATLIIGVATGMAMGGSQIYGAVTDGLNESITQMVTGKNENAYDSIDRSLGYMQLAMSSIDALQVGESAIVNDAKTRNMWFTGIGTGGPAITAGTMLLLNKIAMALFVGLGPLFILCLLFDQTKSLFSRWLFYGIGTMFSLAVLSVMVALALDMVVAVAASFWVGKFLGANQEGINSMALQQGGLGLILTMLIISAPPMAATFFQGMLANFTPYSQFAGGSNAAIGSRPGEPGYRGHASHGAPPMNTSQSVVSKQPSNFNNLGARQHAASVGGQAEGIRAQSEAQQAAGGHGAGDVTRATPTVFSAQPMNAAEPIGSRASNMSSNAPNASNGRPPGKV